MTNWTRALRWVMLVIVLIAVSAAQTVAATPTGTIKVAALAFDPAWGDLDGNIKYRKHGLNPQDQRWTTVGDLGFPVFDTELGRISLLICYDDTYWQYARLAALHNVDIIAWSSASDRVMPGTPVDQAKGDHSTIANV